MKYIVKISPEITIKSKPVRKRCLLRIKNNIKKHLDFHEISSQISGTRDRIIVVWEEKKISAILLKIPGIAYFMEVESFALPEEEKEIFQFIFEKTKDYYWDKIEGKSFVVRVKRSWNHSFTSVSLEKFVWWVLLQHASNAQVKIKDSDITVQLEVKDTTLNIIKQRTQWIWWYPVGFQDKVLSLISWWFDSGVSTYSMMKRWCEVDYLFFNLWWSAHELWVKQVAYYLWKTFWIPHKKARFITVNFEEIIKQLLTKIHHKYRGVLLKRLMLQVASKISMEHYFALIKWDSLGQVSSQTLKNMHVIDKASDTLVLRPLISMNKQEIVDISKDIWTYHFACNMPEYCGVISDKPTTGARLSDILEEEKNISPDIIQQAIDGLKVEFVKDMMDDYKQEKELEVVFLPSENDVVIDIREEALKKKQPLILEHTQIIEIPFFEINHSFKNLDQEKNYLLYCDKWVLSNLHWLYLHEKWFNNIKIYRPIKWVKCK